MATLKRPLADRRGKVRVRWYPVNTDETFTKGDWVYISSGKLSICAAAGNDVGNISLLGRSLANAEDVANSISGLCPVEIADDTAEFAFPIYHGTAASAVTANADIGATYPLRNQGGIWGLNKENDGTNDRIKVTEVDLSRYPLGEQYGVVWGKVIAANRQAD